MDLVTKVRDAEHWTQVLESSDKKLVVVDVHKDWCGSCKIMEPTYKRIATEIDHAERRLVFATLNVGLNVDEIEDTGSCKPRFLFFRDRKQVADVEGANAPLLEQQIKEHLSSAENDDDEI
ncbi:putative Thioredoxin domain-containing protein [Plasmopara halstedii]